MRNTGVMSRGWPRNIRDPCCTAFCLYYFVLVFVVPVLILFTCIELKDSCCKTGSKTPYEGNFYLNMIVLISINGIICLWKNWVLSVQIDAGCSDSK